MALGEKRPGQDVGGTLPLLAGVLIGGQSRRMGSAKALLPHPAGTMVEHVVNVAGRLAREVVLLGELVDPPVALQGYWQIQDQAPGLGPLGGLCSLLDHAGDRWVILLACDMPGISVEAIQRLVEARTVDADAVAYRSLYAWHACCALYHPRILADARAELLGDRRSLQALLRRVRTASVIPSSAEESALVNVNTPHEWAAWGERAHSRMI